jgi:hypothetical protein
MKSFVRIGAVLVALTTGAALAENTNARAGEGTGGSGPVEQPLPPEPEAAEPEAMEPEAAPAPDTLQPETETMMPEEPTTPLADLPPAPAEPESDRFIKVREPPVPLGPYVMVNGGADFYTGNLASRVNPGPSWGAMVGFRPIPFAALEVGYSGAVNELDRDLVPANVNGADLVRNGGNANVVLNLPLRFLQPYVIGGYGLERYSLRGGGLQGYQDDTNSYIPAGIGLHSTVGMFTADLRGTYSFLIDQDFAPVADTDAWDGRIGATLNLGGSF